MTLLLLGTLVLNSLRYRHVHSTNIIQPQTMHIMYEHMVMNCLHAVGLFFCIHKHNKGQFLTILNISHTTKEILH